MKRIGVSMRSCPAESYVEARDGLARDWFSLLHFLGWNWLLVPNLGMKTADYAQAQGIEALILTGGANLGDDPIRDQSELVLLQYATKYELPVLGVCRGMQIMCQFHGGKVISAPKIEIAGLRHSVQLCHFPLWFDSSNPSTLMVNSFHHNVVSMPLSDELDPIALDEDGYCEAFVHKRLLQVGVMWHPERDATLSSFDKNLIKWLFK